MKRTGNVGSDWFESGRYFGLKSTPGAKLLGDFAIEDHTKIGVHAVVIADVPEEQGTACALAHCL
jgi:hypothetical protein